MRRFGVNNNKRNAATGSINFGAGKNFSGQFSSANHKAKSKKLALEIYLEKRKKYITPVFFATFVALSIFAANSFAMQSAYATTLSLSVSSNITTTAKPTSASGTTAVSDTAAANISISTDNATGYTLSLVSNNDNGSNALVGTTSSSNTIPSISAETATLDNFTIDTWGYKPTKKVSGTWTDLTVTSYTTGYYLPGPTTTADILDVTDAANSTANEYNIALGTKVSTSTAVDSYTGSFIVAAVANEIPLYMQDVAGWADIEIPNEGDSIQAADRRDNKMYWVTKLADGNIWMTQNLDYDLVAGTTLTSSDSDVESDWQIDASTYATTGTWNSSYVTSESYNPGDVYLVTSGSENDDTSYSSLSACTTAGNSAEVCQHGHQGNFYNWHAATAGSDASTMSSGDEAPQSICPAGWRLPYSTTADKSWYDLLTTHYGITNSAAGSQALRTSPLYIPRAGYYFKSVNNIGSYGIYWTSTAYGKSNVDYFVYDLYFHSSYVNLQSYGSANDGISMRCVARLPKTVTISVNNSSYGSVSSSSVSADSGSTISTSGNTITFGATTVTATANSGYQFSSWTNNCGSTLTENCTIVANFEEAKDTWYKYSADPVYIETEGSPTTSLSISSSSSASTIYYGTTYSRSGTTFTVEQTTGTYEDITSGYVIEVATSSATKSGATLYRITSAERTRSGWPWAYKYTWDITAVPITASQTGYRRGSTSYGTVTASPGTYPDNGTPDNIYWYVKHLESISDLVYMQDFAMLSDDAKTKVLNSMTTDAQYQLIDSRDFKIYWISKLQDGNVWMTQNLDYDIKTSDNIVSKTSDGTATTWSSQNATSTSTISDTSYMGTYSYDPQNYYLPNGSGTQQTAITCTSVSNGGENCHYHLGNVYQWNAATAGTGGAVTNADATASICPTGWRLPTIGYTNNYSFGKLTNAYGITSSSSGSSDAALIASPLFFVRDSASGDYWSSTASSVETAAILTFGSNYVYPSNRTSYRYNGLSVRCVAL